MTLIIVLKSEEELVIELRKGRSLLDSQSLTINRNLDNMLIRSIDKILSRNRIERLPLKKPKIAGKMRPETVSGMIVGSVIAGLDL